MVYVDSEELKWLPYVKSWLNTINENLLNDESKEFLLELFKSYVQDGLDFVKKNCVYAIHQVDIAKATMICSLMESHIILPGAMEKIGERSKVRCFICQTFVFCYLWGVGGNITDDSMEKFEVFVQSQFEECNDARSVHCFVVDFFC